MWFGLNFCFFRLKCNNNGHIPLLLLLLLFWLMRCLSRLRITTFICIRQSENVEFFFHRVRGTHTRANYIMKWVVFTLDARPDHINLIISWNRSISIYVCQMTPFLRLSSAIFDARASLHRSDELINGSQNSTGLHAGQRLSAAKTHTFMIYGVFYTCAGRCIKQCRDAQTADWAPVNKNAIFYRHTFKGTRGKNRKKISWASQP